MDSKALKQNPSYYIHERIINMRECTETIDQAYLLASQIDKVAKGELQSEEHDTPIDAIIWLADVLKDALSSVRDYEFIVEPVKVIGGSRPH